MATPVSVEVSTDHLEGTRAAFATAARTGRVHESTYRFAGRPARLRVVGDDLAEQLIGTFEIVAEPTLGASTFELEAHLWDRADTGVGCPGIPWAPDRVDLLGPGLVSQYAGGRIVRYERSDVVKALDRVEKEIFVCVDDAERSGLSERSKPFPHLLAAWYLDRGVHVLHAGLVASDGSRRAAGWTERIGQVDGRAGMRPGRLRSVGRRRDRL